MKELRGFLNKLKKPIQIVFIEPDRLHPNSDTTTVGEVATLLEDKYHLIENFTKKYKNEITKKLLQYAKNNPNNWKFLLSEYIKNEWRDYMVSELHNIKTKIATKEQRESFINTGAYYKSLQIIIKV